MADQSAKRNAQAAWKRIEALGGSGVWERELVVVSLSKTAVTDDDLSLFRDFPHVQILDLSHTQVGDGGLAHLSGLPQLEELVLVDTKVGAPAIMAFRRAHPSVTVKTEPSPPGAVNPFTGKPF
jgi:hypothetical protein